MTISPMSKREPKKQDTLTTCFATSNGATLTATGYWYPDEVDKVARSIATQSGGSTAFGPNVDIVDLTTQGEKEAHQLDGVHPRSSTCRVVRLPVSDRCVPPEECTKPFRDRMRLWATELLRSSITPEGAPRHVVFMCRGGHGRSLMCLAILLCLLTECNDETEVEHCIKTVCAAHRSQRGARHVKKQMNATQRAYVMTTVRELREWGSEGLTTTKQALETPFRIAPRELDLSAPPPDSEPTIRFYTKNAHGAGPYLHPDPKMSWLSNFHVHNAQASLNGKAATGENEYQALKMEWVPEGETPPCGRRRELAELIRRAPTANAAWLLSQSSKRPNPAFGGNVCLSNGRTVRQVWDEYYGEHAASRGPQIGVHPLFFQREDTRLNVMRRVLADKFGSAVALRGLLLSTGDARLVEHTGRDRFWGDGGRRNNGRNCLGQLLMELRTKLRLAATFARIAT